MARPERRFAAVQILRRLRLQRQRDAVAPLPQAAPDRPLDEVQAHQLSSVFRPPRWLRGLGRASWLLVGVVALVAGLVGCSRRPRRSSCPCSPAS